MGKYDNRRPNTKVLNDVFKWLDDLGLSVYGQHMDINSGQEHGGCMDYDVERTIKRYEHFVNGTLWRDQ